MLGSTAHSAWFWRIGQNWPCYSARPFHALLARISCNVFLESLKHTDQSWMVFVSGAWNFIKNGLILLWFDKWILTLKFQNTIISWKWSPLKLAKSVCSNTTDHQLGHAKAINGLEAAKVIRQMEGKEVHFQSKLFNDHRNNWCINHAIFHLFKSSTCSIGVNDIFQK